MRPKQNCAPAGGTVEARGDARTLEASLSQHAPPSKSFAVTLLPPVATHRDAVGASASPKLVAPQFSSWACFVTWAVRCGYAPPQRLVELIVRELAEAK
jgi:hypothetical protein